MKKVHFIGICGKGMAGLAVILKHQGYKVTGSDAGFYDPVASYLAKNKIKILTPHKKENIPADVDFIVIGKHAKLVSEENEEVKYAFETGKNIKSLPEILGELSKDKENLVVAGSFGKSTMTALVTWALKVNTKDPSYFIGAIPFGFKENARLGRGKQFIFEGDEYPSSNWDTRSKFLHYHPQDIILISGEHDHINVFPTLTSYLTPYKKLVGILPKKGIIIASKNGKNISKILGATKNKVIYYGLENKAGYHAKNINYGSKTTFTLMKGAKKITEIETTLLGQHNIENIVGASAYLLEKKLVTANELKKAMRTFKGLSGRLDRKPAKSSVYVYESYGSSYQKARSDFEALHTHFPDRNIIAVFEPHTFSWRNMEAKKWYKDVFKRCASVIILPPPTHGKASHNQMDFVEIISTVQKNHKDVSSAETEKEALAILKQKLKKDDIVVLVTSGSILGLTTSTPKLVEKNFPK